MGKATTKAPEAAEAATGATTTQDTTQAVEPTTISIEFYNQAIAIAEGQGERIAELEADLRAANAHNADLQLQLDQANETIENMVPAELKGEAADFDHEKTAFEHNGTLYGFTAKAPAKLRVDDVVYTQVELLNNPDAMISLIVGENSFIKQL